MDATLALCPRDTASPLPSQSTLDIPRFAPRADAPSAAEVMQMLLDDKRSPQTRRAYEGDLKRFFGGDPRRDSEARAAATLFLSWPPPQIAYRLNEYKIEMLHAGAAEATINRRLAAVRSLLKFAYRLGQATTDGRGLVDSEKVEAHRDTRGISEELARKLQKLPAQLHSTRGKRGKRVLTLRGLRDQALLGLLLENALRRESVARLTVRDFSLVDCSLNVLRKGRGTQKKRISLFGDTAADIAGYLQQAGHADDLDGPLFRNFDHRPGHSGGGLTVNGIYWLVNSYGRELGMDNLTPHKLRKTCITVRAKHNGGNVLELQELSGHRKLDTLRIYIQNAEDMQGEATRALGNLFRS